MGHLIGDYGCQEKKGFLFELNAFKINPALRLIDIMEDLIGEIYTQLSGNEDAKKAEALIFAIRGMIGDASTILKNLDDEFSKIEREKAVQRLVVEG